MKEYSVPKNGLLSGMIVTILTAVVVVPLGLFSESFRQRFIAAPSDALIEGFLISIVGIILHKAESYWFREWEHCPLYLTSRQSSWGRDPGQALFVGFVSTLLVMVVLLFLMMKGEPWPLILMSILIAQGLHEIHHSAKSIARRYLYPGTVTSILFVGLVGFWVYPAWYSQVLGEKVGVFYMYYLLWPVLFTAFYFEDRNWYAKAAQSISFAKQLALR